MTDEDQEESFGKYWTAKRAMVAYSLSEDFEEEAAFSTSPDTSASWLANTPRFVRMTGSAGKTYILDTRTISPVKPLVIFPSALTTSEAIRTPTTAGPGDSMATQQSTVREDERAEELIWRIGTTPSIRHRVRLAARLTELQKTVREEEMDGRGIAVRSLQHFFEFLKAYPDLRCPTISATPERNIYVSWKSGSNRVFSVHFLPDGNVRFVIFCPNDKHKGEMIRISGTATADTIISIATPHGVLNWASNERRDNP
jgi:hypothetical protein